MFTYASCIVEFRKTNEKLRVQILISVDFKSFFLYSQFHHSIQQICFGFPRFRHGNRSKPINLDKKLKTSKENLKKIVNKLKF